MHGYKVVNVCNPFGQFSGFFSCPITQTHGRGLENSQQRIYVNARSGLIEVCTIITMLYPNDKMMHISRYVDKSHTHENRMQFNLEAIMLLGPPARAAASLPGQGLLIWAQAGRHGRFFFPSISHQ